MKISLNWLSKYIDIQSYKVEAIAETLTNLGLEVESIEPMAPIQGDVVVGKILSASQHPNGDKLQVCKVDTGDKEPLSIVCGAPNARADLTVAVAKIGSTLPGDFKIKAGKIRGEQSYGMLCSAKELGISQDNDGILELNNSETIGASIVELFNLKDTVLEIGLTPNRRDCLGYVGLARDLAAKLEIPLKQPILPDTSGKSELNSAKFIDVSIENFDHCSRFCALYMRDVSPIPSPLWMQRHLENSGMRPINLIVDASNYAMLESGQPNHAYDIRDLKAKKIIVRQGKRGESLTTLDGQQRTLDPDDIVIADGESAVGLAGVMGGANSEVKEDTTEIIIEVAQFNSSLVRKTSKRHGLHTEASHRFERGVDFEAINFVAKRVAQLIIEGTQEQVAAGYSVAIPTAAQAPVDVFQTRKPSAKVALRLSRARQLTGLRSLTLDRCSTHLERLGFKFLDKTDDRMLFEIPSWRLDIERETDLIEEVARLEGYNEIPYSLPQMEIGVLPEDPRISFFDDSKLTLAQQGFNEVITFPFISDRDLDQFNIPGDHPFRKTVHLQNPLVEDQNQLRTSISFGLVKALVDNRRHGIKGSRLFESARSFYRMEVGSLGNHKLWSHVSEHGGHVKGRAKDDKRPIERNCLAAIIDQPFQDKTWNQREVLADFFHGKEAIARILWSFDIRDINYKTIDPQQIPWLHPTASATFYAGSKYIGYVGELHPRTAKSLQLDFEHPPILLELDLDLLFEAYQTARDYQSSTVKYPPVSRDLAFVVDRSVTHEGFADAFRSFKKRKNLKSYSIFDVYQGEHLDSSKKSMAFNLEFQSAQKTLTDKEVEKEVNDLIDWFKGKLSADLR